MRSALVLTLVLTLVASTARAEPVRADATARPRTPERAGRSSARLPSNETQVSGGRGRARLRSGRLRQNSNAHDLVLALQDDGTDLAFVMTLLGQDDGKHFVARIESPSAGSAQSGLLCVELQLPTHGAYAIRDPSRAWGARDTIKRLTAAFDELFRADPGAPRVRVHDLSLRSGGPMRGHRSHQTGRDVDITYYQRTCHAECDAQPVTASNLDAHRQWRLLQYWLKRGHAEFIFVDYALQGPLHQQAKATGARQQELAHWFQYPRGASFPAGIIRHVANHANHLHVRFRCAQREHTCIGTPTRRALALGLAPPLLELIEDESEGDGLFELLDD